MSVDAVAIRRVRAGLEAAGRCDAKAEVEAATPGRVSERPHIQDPHAQRRDGLVNEGSRRQRDDVLEGGQTVLRVHLYRPSEAQFGSRAS